MTFVGSNASVTLHGDGVTIRNNLLGRMRVVAYADVASITIEEPTWLMQGKLHVVTRGQAVQSALGSRRMQQRAGGEAAEWFVVFSSGQRAQVAALKAEIEQRCAERPPAVGARVLVTWSDGNRYAATVAACEPSRALVLFPNGDQQWVENAYLSPA